MASDDAAGEPRSILKELVVNQYQAILLGGAAAASVIALSPLPLLVWLGAELVTLPLLDSRPLRLRLHRRRLKRSRESATERRAQVIAALDASHQKRFREMEILARHIEANYQGLHGLSQAYLTEQCGKLDAILQSCAARMLALQRYQGLLANRRPADLERQIAALTDELKSDGLTNRARAALQKNVELKSRLLDSHREAAGTIKALSTELDSMASLLEVLHQNSISMRDPDALSLELDAIVRQSEESERAVREMEALLRTDDGGWTAPSLPAETPPKPPPLPRVKDRR